MRFRAWDKTNKRWYDDFIVLDCLGNYYRSDDGLYGIDEDIIILLSSGKFDINNTEIYVGDLLNPGLREVKFGDFISLDSDGTPFSQGNGFYTISHQLDLRPMPFSFAHRQSEGSLIIGNVQENPELLL